MAIVKSVAGNPVRVGGATLVAGSRDPAVTGPTASQPFPPDYYDPGPGSQSFAGPPPDLLVAGKTLLLANGNHLTKGSK